MSLDNVKEFLFPYPCPWTNMVLAPLAIPSKETHKKITSSFQLMIQTTLAGLGVFALCKLDHFSLKRASIACVLGALVSTSATWIGVGGFAFYKGTSNLIPAISARSLSGIATASATALGGWIILNRQPISFGILEPSIGRLAEAVSDWWVVSKRIQNVLKKRTHASLDDLSELWHTRDCNIHVDVRKDVERHILKEEIRLISRIALPALGALLVCKGVFELFRLRK